MYVCICKAVTEQEVQCAIKDGANNICAIRQKLGASSECGNCIECIEDIIAEYVVPVNNIKLINSSSHNSSNI